MEQKPACGRQGRALIFFSQRPTSIPRNTYIHPRDAFGCYPFFQSPCLWVPCSSRTPAISDRRDGTVALIQRRCVVKGGGRSLGGTRLFHHDSGSTFPVRNGFLWARLTAAPGEACTKEEGTSKTVNGARALLELMFAANPSSNLSVR
jgi:hypothetical protein